MLFTSGQIGQDSCKNSSSTRSTCGSRSQSQGEMGTKGCPGIYKWTWNWRAVQTRRGSWTGIRVRATFEGVTGTSVLTVGTISQKQEEGSLKVVLKPGLNMDKLTRLTKPVFCWLHLSFPAAVLDCKCKIGQKIQEKNNFKTNTVYLPCQSPSLF